MKKYIPYIIIGILVACLVFLFFEKKSTSGTTKVISEKVDTIRDTTKVSKPLYISQIIVRHDTIKLSKIKNDTIPYVKDSIIIIPVSQKEYNGDNYKAYTSGYDVKLDSLDLYLKHTTKTVTVTKERSRWNLGISAGYGISKTGLSPYIGVGVIYNLFK